MSKSVGYEVCTGCGIMVDLKVMKDYGKLQGHWDNDTCSIKGGWWNGDNHCHTWICPVCKEEHTTDIVI